MNAPITSKFFDFFKELAAHNHKDWFDENRKVYETHVKAPFESLVGSLVDEMQKTNSAYANLHFKDCIFRINRDIRFSKDKTPYKLNRSAIIAPEGRKSAGSQGFYFEIGPGECAFYAGAYMLEKQALQNVRRKIVSYPNQFQKIISDSLFIKAFGKVQGATQKRLEPDFRNAAESQPLIFNTQFYIVHEFEPDKVLKKDFIKYLLDLNTRAREFADFLNTDEMELSES
jgi:uncharacterized protein (TIGR02453 family)